MNENNLLRVTQINALYLDREILKSAISIINDSTIYLPAAFVAPYDPEIRILVKLALIYYSVMKTGSTFGQNLLAIKYDNMSYLKRFLYLTMSSLDYFKYKLEVWNPKHDFNTITAKVEIFLKLYSLINMTIFLRNGIKPRVVDRILGLDQVYAHENAQRRFDSKYLARELLWNGFIEILVFVIPLINYHKLRRYVRGMYPFYKKAESRHDKTLHFTLFTKCAHCNETPIQPHHMGCAHVFCYVCLKGNLIADDKYECPICDYSNHNLLCEPVSVL